MSDPQKANDDEDGPGFSFADQEEKQKETPQGGRFQEFGLQDQGDQRRIRFSLYNPLTSYRVGITLDRTKLEEIMAKRSGLMARGQEMAMIEYILHERLRLMPPMAGPPGVDTVLGKGDIVHERLTAQLSPDDGMPAPPFRLELLRARVFGNNKITPLQLSGVRDQMANRGSSVREVFVVHVGGTRCVTFSTDHMMNIQARITVKVACIRTCLFLFFI